MIRIVLGISILLIGVLAGMFLLGLSSVGMFVYDMNEELSPEDLSTIPQLSREGYSPVVINVTADKIILIGGCKKITMFTNEFQTFSIKRGLEGIMDYRPNTHDMLKNMMDVFDMRPIMVKINEMIEGTYYARIYVSQGNRILDLDSRPSDAIAIATRTNMPVYVNQSLLNELGETVC